MAKIVKVKDIRIGEGAPKICVPMVGETLEQLKEEAAYLRTLDLDIVEWRVDFFEHVEDLEQVKAALKEIRSILANIPLVFTFRSAREGGKKEINAASYVKLNRAIAETGQVDIIDVELFNEEADVKTLVKAAHQHKVAVIISNHDFHKTPPKGEIISRLRKAQELGGDLPKIAVMPTNTADVLTLLDATRTMAEEYADRPIITMSMAGKGVVSRLTGELFGSALTFGAAQKASAPGQIPVTELREILTVLHRHA
ncbi:type I 3-dehydroquinate dehydratase [Paenibacillus farraposensis]|uniref:3-dehydroquinate dehydratase n=1 Tax=Paenibacillus farraposensis TaxID=2807095 RepID=A0ABW4DA80_9BACL|nr:type I 3-dehydroquinate dehydratase [Paenibacillus farraposensis]MCC3382221.1 type I 3-dehydroquinate dehydratase [Paenibacillus farraposensis]